VLGLSVVDSTKNLPNEAGFDLEGFWRRTLFAAAAARQMSLDAHAGDPDEAFTAGLFQDIGILACMAALKEEYVTVLRSAPADTAGLCERHRALHRRRIAGVESAGDVRGGDVLEHVVVGTHVPRAERFADVAVEVDPHRRSRSWMAATSAASSRCRA
jgi:hypothetical protein